MAVDIYFKLPEYPYYNPSEIEITDDLEMFLQHVEMIITTPKGSILGDPEFGCSLESYLWSTQKGGGEIKQEISTQIYEYVDFDDVNGIPYDIEVSFLKGELWDTAIIDLTIDGTKVAGYVLTP
jgi:hypothetical protein